MICPACQHPRSRVVDTRKAKRRRECLACLMRWTTTEILAGGTVAPAKRHRKIQILPPRSWLERIQQKLG